MGRKIRIAMGRKIRIAMGRKIRIAMGRKIRIAMGRKIRVLGHDEPIKYSLCTDSIGLLYRRIVELNSKPFLCLQQTEKRI